MFAKKIDENTYEVTTPKCFHCGNESVFVFNSVQYERYFLHNDFVQDIFPDWQKEEREVLISGTHADCWNLMFPDIEDDEYEEVEND